MRTNLLENLPENLLENLLENLPEKIRKRNLPEKILKKINLEDSKKLTYMSQEFYKESYDLQYNYKNLFMDIQDEDIYGKDSALHQYNTD